ncbi:MAG TPA: DnaA N-terminal domain-containing protein, partial [Clostridia bacterium]|nr:DnaA N-terminal domain-containing protein [Clostridia bacterium]
MAKRTADSIWGAVCSQTLSKEINPLTYNTWFSTARPYFSDERTFGLSVPNDFAMEYISQHRDLIEASLRKVSRVHYALEIAVREDGSIPSPDELDRLQTIDPKVNSNGAFQAGKLNPDYSFSNFIVGSGNNFAHA